MRLFLAVLLSLFVTTATAQPRPKASPWNSPFATILKWPVDDITNAIKVADAANPPDTDAVTCYQSLLSTAQLVANNGGGINWPPQLVTDYELAWLIHRNISNLKVNSSCAVVCGRAATMLAIYGMAINNFCTALAKLP